MKYMFKYIISLLILIISSFQTINAETWSCSYLWNGEVQTTLYKRSGGQFVDGKGDSFRTFFESKHNIVIGMVFDVGAYIVYLDKSKRKFRSVVLEIVERNKKVIMKNREVTGSSQGSCNIF